jgi:endonuclease YncB( thermonuclease family)
MIQLFLLPLWIYTSQIKVACAASLSGQVFSVNHGDQITVSLPSNEFRDIRLLGIESQPYHTPGGRSSRRHLQMLLASKLVTVEYHSMTPNGTILGRVLHGGIDINLRMIEAGLVRVVQHTGLDKNRLIIYLTAQNMSQQKGLGMWKKSP